MSTTPRSDNAKEQYLTGKMGIYGVLDETRRLETELAAAKQEIADALDTLGYGPTNSIHGAAIDIMSELTRLRAENKLLCAAQKISEDSDGAIVMEVISLRARAEKAEADTARLDWLEANSEAIRAYSIHKSTFGRKVWWETGFGNYHTAREAIDAAMKEASK